ncbi:MAG: 16S rRNA (cytosine(1402)-N(4))-methyltransferase RsmH [Christensenellales bacterium]
MGRDEWQAAFRHKPVMEKECIELLNAKNGGRFVDGTLGGGGHSEAILSIGNTEVYGIDRDADAIAAASDRLSKYGDKFIAIKGNFKDAALLLPQEAMPLDGAILDLGVSSYQLDKPERGFSYMNDAPLDMRMDASDAISAYDVINEYDRQRLSGIIRDYGEERWASRIAAFIEQRRKIEPIRTTFELVDVIKAAIPAGARRQGPHPAKRTFQAIRIEVNGELEGLSNAVKSFVDLLKPGGRLVVITFHSLEDRAVKLAMREMENPCVCPPKAPVCVCGKRSLVKLVSRKAVKPSKEELENNPRARSAKVRAAERL